MNTQTNPLSPFFSIWIKPRGTIRQILDTNPKQYVLLLAVLSGIYRAIDRAAEQSLGDRFPLIPLLVLCIIGGCIAGVLWLYIGGVYFRWVGGLLGGQASSEEVRAAIAWSAVPDLVLLAIHVPIIIIFGHNWFVSSDEWMSPTLALVILAVLVPIGLVLLVWRIFLFIKCLAEAHMFSAWKGLGTVVLGVAILLVPIIVIQFLLGQ